MQLIEKPKALVLLGNGKGDREHNEDANLFRIGKLYGLSRAVLNPNHLIPFNS